MGEVKKISKGRQKPVNQEIQVVGGTKITAANKGETRIMTGHMKGVDVKVESKPKEKVEEDVIHVKGYTRRKKASK